VFRSGYNFLHLELALRGRIELERAGMKRKGLLSRLVSHQASVVGPAPACSRLYYFLFHRKIMLKNADPCGDVLLDEALKHIKVGEITGTHLSWTV
jgi:Golgi phosphoprotein 3